MNSENTGSQTSIDTNFKKYFDETILPIIKENKYKLLLNNKICLYILSCLVLLSSCMPIFLMYRLPMLFLFIIIPFLLLVCIPCCMILASLFAKYNYKKDIYPVIFSYFGNFKYTPIIKGTRRSDFLGLNEYMKGNFIVDDYMTGTYNNKPVRVVELKNEVASYGAKEISYNYGILLSFPQKRKTNANIIIKNSRTAVISSNLPVVKLEDIEFRKIYSVFSNDQIEARFILTPKYMETVKRFNQEKKYFNYKPSYIFKNGYVHIFLEAQKDHFELNLDFQDTDNDLFRKVYAIKQQLETILHFIDDLDLCD